MTLESLESGWVRQLTIKNKKQNRGNKASLEEDYYDHIFLHNYDANKYFIIYCLYIFYLRKLYRR